MRRALTILIALGVCALALVGCAVVAAESDLPAGAESPGSPDPVVEVLKFDMAEDFTRFVFEPDIVSDEGYPIRGNPFMTQGYLYPEGTLGDSTGVNADGSPAFPDKVIGIWICRGWVLSDTMGSDGGPAAITTQVFQFGEEYGDRMIITEGYEFMAPGHVFSRAITGGSGEYSGARGEQTQEVLPINEYMGTELRFELRLQQ